MNEFDKLLREGRTIRNKAAADAAVAAENERLFLQEQAALARDVIETAKRVASVALNGNRKVSPDTQLVRTGRRYQYRDLFRTWAWNKGGTKVTYALISHAWTLLEYSAGGWGVESRGGVALAINGDLYITTGMHSHATMTTGTTEVDMYREGTRRTEPEAYIIELNRYCSINAQELLVRFVLKHELDV